MPQKVTERMVLDRLVEVAGSASPDNNPYPGAATGDALARFFGLSLDRMRKGSLAGLLASRFVEEREGIYWLTHDGLRTARRDALSSGSSPFAADAWRLENEQMLQTVTEKWRCLDCRFPVTRPTGYLTTDVKRAKRWNYLVPPRVVALCGICVHDAPEGVVPAPDRKRLASCVERKKLAIEAFLKVWPDTQAALTKVKLSPRQRDAVVIACTRYYLSIDPTTIRAVLAAEWGEVMESVEGWRPFDEDEYESRDDWWEQVARDEAAFFLASRLSEAQFEASDILVAGTFRTRRG